MKKNLKISITTITIMIFFLGNFLTLAGKNHQQTKKMWSILICTLEERKKSFEYLYQKLQNQITKNKLNNQIEVLFFKDNREVTIGFKRNSLLQQSTGEYVCFIDDDDDIHENYIAMIYEKLLEKPDCVRLVGIRTINGKHAHQFIQSMHYQHYVGNDQLGGISTRPVTHLNPIKRSIALQFTYPDKNKGEDSAYAFQLAKTKLLKKEAYIDEPYYFYRFNEKDCSNAFLKKLLKKKRIRKQLRYVK